MDIAKKLTDLYIGLQNLLQQSEELRDQINQQRGAIWAFEQMAAAQATAAVEEAANEEQPAAK